MQVHESFVIFPSHVRDCGVIIDDFDHTCPWTGTGIGGKNMPFFTAFLYQVSSHPLPPCALRFARISVSASYKFFSNAGDLNDNNSNSCINSSFVRFCISLSMVIIATIHYFQNVCKVAISGTKLYPKLMKHLQ